MHDEALLRPRKGEQQAPIKVGVRDAQVCEWLWLTLVARGLGGFANHRYVLLHAADRMYTIRPPHRRPVHGPSRIKRNHGTIGSPQPLSPQIEFGVQV